MKLKDLSIVQVSHICTYLSEVLGYIPLMPQETPYIIES